MIRKTKLEAGLYRVTVGDAVWLVRCHARGWWVGTCGDRVLDPMPTLRDVEAYLVGEVS